MDSEILLAEDAFFLMILCAKIAHAALQLENTFFFNPA